jgi:hypothetical protein
MPNLKKSQTHKLHIWFLPTHKANAEKPKELALPHRHPNRIFTLYTQFYEIIKIIVLN